MDSVILGSYLSSGVHLQSFKPSVPGGVKHRGRDRFDVVHITSAVVGSNTMTCRQQPRGARPESRVDVCLCNVSSTRNKATTLMYTQKHTEYTGQTADWQCKIIANQIEYKTCWNGIKSKEYDKRRTVAIIPIIVGGFGWLQNQTISELGNYCKHATHTVYRK